MPGREHSLEKGKVHHKWDKTNPPAIEIDPVMMQEIGVLTCVSAAGAEPGLPRLLVNAFDAAHDPLLLFRVLTLELDRETHELDAALVVAE